MKTIFMLIVACAVLCHAESTDASTYVKNTVSRSYLGSVGSVFSDSLSFSNEVTVSKGSYYAGLWMATGPGNARYKEDWDPYVGFVRSIGPARYEATATYFFLRTLARTDDDLWMLDQKISVPACPLAEPYLKLRAFNKVGSKSFESGWFGWVGLSKTVKVRSCSISEDLSAAYSDGPFGKAPGPVYARSMTAFSFPLTKSMTITPSVIYQVPMAEQRRVRKPFTTRNEFVWSLSVGYPWGSK